jgi:hypothetical protein
VRFERFSMKSNKHDNNEDLKEQALASGHFKDKFRNCG